MRPWYAVLHRVDFANIALLAYFLLWFGVLIAAAFRWVPVDSSKEQNPGGSALAQLVIFGVIAILFSTGIALNRFRDSFFPRAVFLIG
jgi:hypothetical protein